MKSKNLRTEVFKTLIFLVIILIFASQNSCSTSRGMTVAPKNRIPLIQDTPQQGTWESGDVFLQYEFVKEDGTVGIIIDGTTKRKLDQVAVWLLFLDKKGRLLERETVYNSGFRTICPWLLQLYMSS